MLYGRICSASLRSVIFFQWTLPAARGKGFAGIPRKRGAGAGGGRGRETHEGKIGYTNRKFGDIWCSWLERIPSVSPGMLGSGGSPSRLVKWESHPIPLQRCSRYPPSISLETPKTTSTVRGLALPHITTNHPQNNRLYTRLLQLIDTGNNKVINKNPLWLRGSWERAPFSRRAAITH